MKLREVLKKLVIGGYFSGSADTDIAITKAISQIRKELEKEIDENWQWSHFTGKEHAKAIIKSFCGEE